METKAESDGNVTRLRPIRTMDEREKRRLRRAVVQMEINDLAAITAVREERRLAVIVELRRAAKRRQREEKRR